MLKTFDQNYDPWQTYKNWFKEQGITEDYYPYAKTGLKIFGVFQLFIKIMAYLFLAKIVSWMFYVFIKAKYDQKFDELAAIDIEPDEPTGSLLIDKIKSFLPDQTNVWDVLYRFAYFIDDLIKLFIVLTILATIIVGVTYFIYMVKRWRSWERNVFTSDREAYMLKKQINNALGLSNKIRELSKKLSKNKLNSKTDNVGDWKDEDKLETLKLVKHVDVKVNTRQDPEDKEIRQRYEIRYVYPETDEQIHDMESLIKNIPKIATRVTKGQVQFGEMMVSPDRLTASFIGEREIDDKYALNTGAEEKEFYATYSFPLSLFINHTEERLEKTEKAKQWAENVAKGLDAVLATKNTAANRISFTVGATSVLFIYELPFSLNLGDLDGKAKMFDSVFKTTGTVVNIVEGTLQITMPVPPALHLPIDVPSIYETVYGKEKRGII